MKHRQKGMEQVGIGLRGESNPFPISINREIISGVGHDGRRASSRCASEGGCEGWNKEVTRNVCPGRHRSPVLSFQIGYFR